VLDNIDLESLMGKLEKLEDEELAVQLLRELNDSTSSYGKLLLNQNKNLSHEQWKHDCDAAKIRVDNIIKRIQNL